MVPDNKRLHAATRRVNGALGVAGVFALFVLCPAPGAAQDGGATWRLDNLERIGGNAVTVVGNPRVVQTDLGPAVEFNGRSDGLFVEVNPVAGLKRFTIDVLFQPAPDGPEEQRFLHIEEADTGSRALIELRMLPGGRWSLDTFLRANEKGLTLLDRANAHPAGRWHSAALTYDGMRMTHYVNGVRELSGEIAFPPTGAGRISFGVRQNQVSWFKGRIHSARITPEALPAERLRRPPVDTAAHGESGSRVIPLWPEGVPGAKPDGGEERIEDSRIYNVQVPTLTYLPPIGTPSGTAVILCPGGGYVRLAVGVESAGLAARLRPLGVATFILKYRLAEYGHPAPLQDVLRAVRMLRSRAAEFGIRPDRIGVMGSSAGGHVAAAAATLFDAPEGRTGVALDSMSARPDFVALQYPVITMEGAFVHAGSRRSLLGESPATAVVERMSLEKQVRTDGPPVFLVHTAEDRSVPLENSLMFYQALRRAGVPAELHVYEEGPHGFGTRTDLGTTSGWVDRLIEWMKAGGWI
jgi:acetyl esterase/lipase